MAFCFAKHCHLVAAPARIVNPMCSFRPEQQLEIWTTRFKHRNRSGTLPRAALIMRVLSTPAPADLLVLPEIGDDADGDVVVMATALNLAARKFTAVSWHNTQQWK